MNRIYCTVWSDKAGGYIAVSELCRRRGKKSSSCTSSGASRLRLALKVLSASIMLTFGSNAMALPTGGVVVDGSASIISNTSSMTINQSSQNTVVNWQGFNIAAGEAVNFAQPNSSSVALNRVLGSDPSNIFGSLTANGRVFLVNPNGVLFGKSASVNVGGMVASTLNISNADFMAGKYNFTGTSTASVQNEGSIHADGGYIALLGAKVSNAGVLSAQLGTVALAAGNVITLDVVGDGLLNIAIDEGVMNGLVENGGLIKADGGQVFLSAQAAGNLLQTVVNNTGIIQAQTIQNKDGVIKLLGDMQSGTVNAGGTLDASAPNGGDGGFIETSAAHVSIKPDLQVTTAAANGLTGSWLIDPTDYTIAASGGDITGALLSSQLGSSNITIQTVSGGSDAGDINVDDTVSWSANKLTLNAHNDININATMNASGTAQLALEYGQGAVALDNTSQITTAGAGKVNLPASTTNFTTKQGSDGNVKAYTVITSLGAAGSTTGSDLQGMNGGLAGNYVLGSNIDAIGIGNFTPVGSAGSMFTGTFDGLGNTISNLTVSVGNLDGGLFGSVSYATIQNLNLDTVSINADPGGALAGTVDYTTIRNVTASNVTIDSVASGWVTQGGLIGNATNSTLSGLTVDGSSNIITSGHRIGGLVAYLSNSTLDLSSSNANIINGGVQAGGLVANSSNSTVSNSTASGNITAWGYAVGGLIGTQSTGSTLNSSATGDVTGGRDVGGLIGIGSGIINGSFATGAVTGGTYSNKTNTGGLAGGFSGTITNSYATGAVSGDTKVGGLVGSNSGTISNSESLASDVSGTSTVGGLVGLNTGTISDSQLTGLGVVTASDDYVGGLVGQNLGSVTNATVSGTSTVTGVNFVGGLAGANGNSTNATASITESTSGATITVGDGSTQIGGIVGNNYALIINSNSSGLVTSGINATAVGGLVGLNTGTIVNTLSNVSSVVAGAGAVGTGTLLGMQSGMENGSLSTGTVTVDGVTSSTRIGYAYTDGLISTASELNYVTYFLNKDFTLTNNLDMTGIAFTPLTYGLGHAPGGGESIPIFDGQGYTISNLTVSVGNVNGGLFGNVSYATIQNLNLDTVSINADPAGALAGTVDHSTIRNVTASNVTIDSVASSWVTQGGLIGSATNSTLSGLTVDGASNIITSGHRMGGLVAYLSNSTLDLSSSNANIINGGVQAGGLVANSSNSTVSNSTASGNITAWGYAVGGLIGTQSTGSTLNSSATGDVTGGRDVGGLIGIGSGIINGSFATGAVTGGTYSNKTNTGGLAGGFSGTITNSYATGAVSGDTQVGGLVGLNSGTISSSYSVGSVSGTSTVGGLVGSNTGTVTSSYWDTQTTGQASSAGGTGRTTAEMKDQANVATNLAGFEFKTTGWAFGSGVNNDYPIFSGPIHITINLADTTRIYGSANPMMPGFTTTGSWLAGDSLDSIDWGSAASATTAVGIYSYSTSNLLSSTFTFDIGHSAADYIFSWSTNALTVTPAPLTVTASATTKTYGQTPSTFAFTSSGLLNSETIGLVYGSSAGAAGTASVSAVPYVVTPTLATGGTFNEANYDITYADGSMVVNPAVLTYNAAASSQTYGNANTAFTGTVTGFFNGENLGSVTTGTASFVSTTSATDNIGSYAINGTGLTVNNGNYTFANAAGNSTALTIDPATLTVTANSADKTYDGLDYSGGNGVIYSGFVNSETTAVLGGALAYGGTAQSAINAGSYAITPGGLTANNYAFSYVDGSLTVTPAILTYNAAASSQTYGDANTAFTGTVTGFVNSETLGSATTGTASFASATSATDNVGSYAINGSGLTANNGNYTFVDATGSATALTINPAALTITGMTADDKVYDGTTLTSLAGGTLNGLVNSDTLSFTGQSGAFGNGNVANGKAVTVTGVTLVDGTGLSSNYTVSNPTGLTGNITPATLTVTGMNADNKVFDGSTVATLSGGTLSGLVNSETLSFTGHSGAFADDAIANGKAVTVTGITLVDGTGLSGNYTVSNPTGLTADITQPTLTGAAGSAVTNVVAMTFTPPAQTSLSTGSSLSGTSSESALASGSESLSESDIAAESESSTGSDTVLESDSSSESDIASASDAESGSESLDEKKDSKRHASIDLGELNLTMIELGIRMPKAHRYGSNKARINKN